MSTVFILLWSVWWVKIFSPPDLSLLTNYRPPETSFVLDENGEILGGFARENRVVLPLLEMGDLIPKAFIAAEDRRFYNAPTLTPSCSWLRFISEKLHVPIDWCSLGRAVRRNIKEGRFAEGGSGISQQLAGITFLQRDSFERTRVGNWQLLKKIRKGIIAYYIERDIPQDRILELYLNHIYLGNGNYGVEAAAQWYFQKSAKEIQDSKNARDVAAAALLAGLPRSPRYSPYNHPEEAGRLRARVLQRLQDEGIAMSAVVEEAGEVPLPAERPEENYRLPSSHLVEYVRLQLENDFGEEEIWQGGLRVYTTVNKKIQEAAESGMADTVAKYYERHPETQEKLGGAVVVMEVMTGDIKAWVNNDTFRERQIDFVYQTRRHPGSAFKVAVYTAAILNGMRLRGEDEGSGSYHTYDVRTVCFDMGKDKEGTPRPQKCIKNYPYETIDRYRGLTDLATALWESRNAGTMWLVREKEVTPDQIAGVAKTLGIESDLKREPSLALGGSSGVTLLELTKAVNTIAAMGKKVEPRVIRTVWDRSGKLLKRYEPRRPIEVLPERVALQMIRGLRGVVEYEHGTANSVSREFICKSAAGKTGTATNEQEEATDNLFVGFTPSYVFGGWMGFPRGSIALGKKESGGKNIVPIFTRVMNTIYEDGGCESFPEGTDPHKPFREKPAFPRAPSDAPEAVRENDGP